MKRRIFLGCVSVVGLGLPALPLLSLSKTKSSIFHTFKKNKRMKKLIAEKRSIFEFIVTGPSGCKTVDEFVTFNSVINKYGNTKKTKKTAKYFSLLYELEELPYDLENYYGGLEVKSNGSACVMLFPFNNSESMHDYDSTPIKKIKVNLSKLETSIGAYKKCSVTGGDIRISSNHYNGLGHFIGTERHDNNRYLQMLGMENETN